MTSYGNSISRTPSMNLPAMGSFITSIIESLKMHDGKAVRNVVKADATRAIRERYHLKFLSADLDLELQYRVERAVEILLGAGILVRQGLGGLRLTPTALVLTDPQLEAIPKSIATKSELAQRPVSHSVLPAPDELVERIVDELRLRTMSYIEIEEHVLKSFAREGNLVLGKDSLQEIERRTVMVVRILQWKRLIVLEENRVFALTELGIMLETWQVKRITCLSLSSFARKQFFKLFLHLEMRAQIDAGKRLRANIQHFLIGLTKYLIGNRRPSA